METKVTITILALSFALLGYSIFAGSSILQPIRNNDFSELEWFEISQIKDATYQPQKSIKEFEIHPSPILITFNPNTANFDELYALGIPKKVIYNIMKYRKKGGYFYKPDSFAKVYGLSKGLFDRLSPFIDIPKKNKIKTVKQKNYQRKEKAAPTDTILGKKSINFATVQELEQINGVSLKTAERIITNRQILGGFYSFEQIEQVVWGIAPQGLTEIKRLFSVNESEIQKELLTNELNFKKIIRLLDGDDSQKKKNKFYIFKKFVIQNSPFQSSDGLDASIILSESEKERLYKYYFLIDKTSEQSDNQLKK